MATKKTTNKAKSKKIVKSTKATTSSVRVLVSSKKTSNTPTLIGKLQIISAAVFVLLAAITSVIMKATNFQLSFGHLAKDELTSQTNTVLVPAAHNFLDMDIRWVLVGVLILSAVVPLLSVTKLRSRYQLLVKSRVQSMRWIDLAISGAFVVGVIAISSGVYDVMTLKLVAALTVLAGLFGWISEQQNSNTAKPVWSAFVGNVLAGALPWLTIGSSLYFTYVYGMVTLPWYIYVAAASGFAGFILQTVNYLNYLKRRSAWQNYWTVERNYLVINLLSKVILAIVLIVGLRR